MLKSPVCHVGHPPVLVQVTDLARQLRYLVMFDVEVGLDVRGRPPCLVVRGVVEWSPASCDVKMKRPSGGPRVPLSISCNASEEAGQSVSASAYIDFHNDANCWLNEELN